jgi:hypothetical protein
MVRGEVFTSLRESVLSSVVTKKFGKRPLLHTF